MPSIQSNWELPTIHDTWITKNLYKAVVSPSELTSKYAKNNFNRIFDKYAPGRTVEPNKLVHACSAINLKLAVKHELQISRISYDKYRLSAGSTNEYEGGCGEVVEMSTVFINEGDFVDFPSTLASQLPRESEQLEDYHSVTLEQFEKGIYNIVNNGGDTRLTYSQLNSL
ncbi:hypothetical protein JA1_004574 [Spathaspora sp. JA1]|nr:hypothetical protein JA1_004574 [Spathaspora sp. JA1]